MDKIEERLSKIETDIGWIREIMGNHLRHHWAITLGACTAAISAIATIIILVVKTL